MSKQTVSPSKKAEEFLVNERSFNDSASSTLAKLVHELSLGQSNEESFDIITESVEDSEVPAPRKTTNSDIRSFLISRQNLEYLEELSEERKANVEDYPRYC